MHQFKSGRHLQTKRLFCKTAAFLFARACMPGKPALQRHGFGACKGPRRKVQARAAPPARHEHTERRPRRCAQGRPPFAARPPRAVFLQRVFLLRKSLKIYEFSYIISLKENKAKPRAKGGDGVESYLSIREAAQKWGVSQRRVNQYCAEGRIPGAQRVGKNWAIPTGAEKPGDPRRARRQAKPAPPPAARGGQVDHANLMPLMNTPFAPGHCRQTVQAMPPGPRRDIAMAEYYYFTGHPAQAARAAEPYLTSPDMGLHLSACLIYAYASLSLKRAQRAKFALGELNASLASAGAQMPRFRAAAAFVAFAGTVLLHLPLPEEMPQVESFLPLLPPGLRAFALYVQAHYLYLKKEYAHSAGMVEATLAMGASAYPISAIYLHLVAVMNYMSMKQTGRAQAHLLAAWEIARPDDLIEGFGEHHGLLGAMLEAVIKPKWPEDFKRVIDITYRFSSGWRRVHNPITGHDVADDLTTTEFAIAMLAARDWTTQEIAQHLDISANTVKTHIYEAMRKLNVENRKGLKQHMLL